ncbi:MAG: esterase/lipase family protein [Planctomycetota bacterium]|jgi:pimeloyl-ACP methyl ester carboxylesterase
MTRLNYRCKIIIGILLCALVLSISGCAGPYSAKKRSITELFEQRQKNALNSNQPSELTQQYLRLENLTDLYEKDRTEFFRQFYDRVVQTRDLQDVRVMAELSLLEGRKQSTRDIENAKALYLTAAEASYRYLLENDELLIRAVLNPTYRFVAEIYNAAVTELVNLKEIEGGPWLTERTYLVGNTVYEFILAEPSDEVWDPETFDKLIPAYEIKTKGLRNQYYTTGLGAPLIGVVNDPSEELYWGELFEGKKATYPVTAMLIFEPPRMEGSKRHVKTRVVFYNPLTLDDITINDMQVPLEVDYSTPLVVQLEDMNPSSLGLGGMFNSDKKIAETGLFLLEPYNPDKIPVLMVHGLKSSPLTWMEMFNDLRGQPEIRNRYQFWFFSYPTGVPVLYSSSILRQKLLEVQQELDPKLSNPNFNNMVLVGHSMGGLLSRVMMQDSGNIYWNNLFSDPIDQIQVSESTRELLRQSLFFESIPFIQRVIFIAAPHRGSPSADRWYSALASGMIDVPGNLVTATGELLSDEQTQFNKQAYNSTRKYRFRSIDNLSATSPFIVMYNQVPVRDDIPYHSIIGIQNAKTGPGSSDGVVPYESSHIDFAVSECLVASDHAAPKHPDAIDEVKRILLLHLESNDIINNGKSKQKD